MGQQVLTVEYAGEKIVSKPFDFEAMCLIDDCKGGMLRKGENAVAYLFEGTKVTDAVLKTLPMDIRTGLSLKVCEWFKTEMENSRKNEQCLPT